MIAIIDGDSILYRACYGTDDLEYAKKKYLEILRAQIDDCWADKAICFVKGKGNWRHKVFKYYKAHRSTVSKEDHLKSHGLNMELMPPLLDWLVASRLAIPSNGMEADDLVRRKALKCEARGENYTIVSADKDLDCIVGKHLRPYKDKTSSYFITPEEADYNYYKQIMIGDSTDFIKSPRLLGPKTAEKLLKETSRGNWKKMIEKEYKERCGSEWFHALMFTGSLIHIQRYANDFFVWDKTKGDFWECGFSEAPKCYGYKLDGLEAK